MARRNEHSLAEIKEMVLNAAETLVIEEGFAALTIRKIAMEMGYTVGSVYMVFASRAELILHLNARTLEDIAMQLKPLTVTGDIEVWLKAYLHYVHANTRRWRLVFTQNILEVEPLPDWYQAHLETIFQQFSGYFTVTASELSPQVVRAVWQGIHGICLLSSVDDIDASVLLLLRSVLRGI